MYFILMHCCGLFLHITWDLTLSLMRRITFVAVVSAHFCLLVAEPDLLDRLKKNNVSKAHFLIQKASLEYSTGEPNEKSKILPFLKVSKS